MISPAIARRRAELAARHRALGVQLRDARNEFFALGKVFDQIEYAGRACLLSMATTPICSTNGTPSRRNPCALFGRSKRRFARLSGSYAANASARAA